jgi:hypothetical protein
MRLRRVSNRVTYYASYVAAMLLFQSTIVALPNFEWVIGSTWCRNLACSLSSHLALRGRLVIAVPMDACSAPLKVAHRNVTLDALVNSSRRCRCRTTIASQCSDGFSARADRTSSLPQCVCRLNLSSGNRQASAESEVSGETLEATAVLLEWHT